jgi:hypothetical protein
LWNRNGPEYARKFVRTEKKMGSARCLSGPAKKQNKANAALRLTK